jgi:hypothetical protein
MTTYNHVLTAVDNFLDDAHADAAEAFLAAVRRNLAPFDLSRHQLHFSAAQLHVGEAWRGGKAKRASAYDRYYFEIRYRRGVVQAIYGAANAFLLLPEGVQKRLAGRIV